MPLDFKHFSEWVIRRGVRRERKDDEKRRSRFPRRMVKRKKKKKKEKVRGGLAVAGAMCIRPL